jgi:MarR family 2-MHQ and catechol resistance regulon transcriptional repressor
LEPPERSEEFGITRGWMDLPGPAGSGPRVAAQFQEHYPEVDGQSIEACLRIFDSSVAERAAVARYFEVRRTPKTPARFAVLRALYFAEEERLAQHQIRKDMRVTSANVTRLIHALEREGLVTRAPDTKDRRVTYVELTASGRRVASDMIPAMASFMEQMLKGFSDDEKRSFNEFLRRFHHNAQTSYPLASE